MAHTLSKNENLAREMVCLPLDGLHSLEEIKSMVEELSPYVGLFKIGKESFTRFGPKAVEIVHKHDSKVFLDLKYKDIPNTVKGAAQAVAELGTYMFNVHADGGLEMMKAAVEGTQNGGSIIPKVIAVTVLTSLDDNILNNEIGVPSTVNEQVLRLAKLSEKAGMNGIVCSALDLNAITKDLPKDFMFVTPGIKGPNTEAGSDQKRIATPSNAVTDGSNILVIGRAITGFDTAEKRQTAAYEVLKDIAKVL